MSDIHKPEEKSVTVPLPLALGLLHLWLIGVLAGQYWHAGRQHQALDVIIKSGPVWAVIIAACVLLLVAWASGRSSAVGLRPPAQGSWRLLILPALLILVLGFLAVLTPGHTSPMWFFVLSNTLFVGLSEELLFRGFMLSALSARWGWRIGLTVTTLGFGLVHVLNGFVTGDFGGAMTQALIATFTGLWLGALRLRTQSLWPCIIFHALWDASLVLTPPVVGLMALPMVALLAIYGAVLIWNLDRKMSA